MSELTTFAAHQLLALFRSGRLSPVEVTNAVLARIEQLNPTINAFCLVDAAITRDKASSAGKRIATTVLLSVYWKVCQPRSRI
ncbi:MAG: hypothetical protein LW805_11440 [Oxalobacteraceae bacterium]|nr:hypothetical protein [Oxalobacteraceae bacterium]